MARTPTQLSVIRWNLSQTPQAYGPPSLPPITFSPLTPATGKAGVRLSVFVDADGGQGATSFSATGLPQGATLDTNLGGQSCAVRWTPWVTQVGGPYTVTVTAQDQACQTASTTVNITVTQ